MNHTNELGKKLYTGEFTRNSIWIFGLLTEGSKRSSQRIEKGEYQIKLTAASPGIYFIEVDCAGNQINWLVEWLLYKGMNSEVRLFGANYNQFGIYDYFDDESQ